MDCGRVYFEDGHEDHYCEDCKFSKVERSNAPCNKCACPIRQQNEETRCFWEAEDAENR